MIRFKAAKLARSPGFLRRDEEDLRQELALHVVQRMQRHDSIRASVQTYADRVLTSKVIDLVRRARAKRRDLFRQQSLEELPARTLAELQQRPCRDERQSELRQDLTDALARMPIEDRGIALALAEAPLVRVARLTGRSRQSVRTARERIRRHLETAGWTDEK